MRNIFSKLLSEEKFTAYISLKKTYIIPFMLNIPIDVHDTELFFINNYDPH